MKKELLEYLVRACAKEVIQQLDENFYRSNGRPSPILSRAFVNEADDETKGAAAPPADGQGTADQPPVPKAAKEPKSQEPSQPETPKEPKSFKGINLVNPRDKSKIDRIELSGDAASIERVLHRKASSVAGSKVKISIGAMRAIDNALKNPSIPLFLYIGKFDPESEELFVMADNSLQIAKDSSVSQDELSSGLPGTFQATDIADPKDYDPDQMGAAYAQKQAGYSDRSQIEPEIEFGDNSFGESIRPAIKALVNEILNRK